MKLRDYLRERQAVLILWMVFLAALEVMLLAVSEPMLQIYVGIGIPAGLFLDMGLEFRKKKRFYDSVERQAQEMDQVYLLPEVVEDADFLEGKYLIQFLKEMETSMAERVKAYKKDHEEYKDYIEMWIHEIKLPIATGKMIAENHRSEAMDSMEEELQKIEDYTEQALYYARSYNVEKDYLIKEVPLQTVVAEVLKKNKKVLIAEKIKIQMEGLETTVFTDSKWMVFVLNQIVSNSIKYRGKYPVISFSAAKRKEQVVFTIRDNGIGISAGEMGRVFEKGFTGSNGRGKQKSTGIGLYLCQKLCSRLGHTIHLFSKEGEGTEVSIIFPVNSYYL